jgi:plasmid stabilization system protein ParE
MTEFSVDFSPRAKREIRSIERYIAKKGSPRDAADFVDRIIKRCERIALAPYQGNLHEDLRPGLRKTGMEDRVAVLFTVKGETVTILSIAYGGRQFTAHFLR